MARTKNPAAIGSSSRGLAVTRAAARKKRALEEEPEIDSEESVEDVPIHHVQTRRAPISGQWRIIGFVSDDVDTQYVMYPSIRPEGDWESDTPPHSPEGDSVFTQVKAYPFGAVQCLTRMSERRYDYISRREVVPTLYLDYTALDVMGVIDEVSEILLRTGLSILLREDPETYPDMVLEFLSSFEPISIRGSLSAWRFQMGGFLWEVSEEVLREWFHFPRPGYIPADAGTRVSDFWREITGAEYAPGRPHSATAILDHRWLCIHRFIACAFFARSDAGRFVQRQEIVIMSAMAEGRELDWLEILTRGLEAHQSETARNQSVGGGSFVTILARKLFFDLDGGRTEHSALTLAGMVSRTMITPAPYRWRRSFPAQGGEADVHHYQDMPDVHPSPPPASAWPAWPSFDIPPSYQGQFAPSSSSQPPPSASPEQQSTRDLLFSMSGRLTSIERVQTQIRADQSYMRGVLDSIVAHLHIQPPEDD